MSKKVFNFVTHILDCVKVGLEGNKIKQPFNVKRGDNKEEHKASIHRVVPRI